MAPCTHPGIKRPFLPKMASLKYWIFFIFGFPACLINKNFLSIPHISRAKAPIYKASPSMRCRCWCGHVDMLSISVELFNVFTASGPEGEMVCILLEPARTWMNSTRTQHKSNWFFIQHYTTVLYMWYDCTLYYFSWVGWVGVWLGWGCLLLSWASCWINLIVFLGDCI